MKKIISILVIVLTLFIIKCDYIDGYEEYKSGDLVRYNDIAFYVLFDSSSEEDSVQLLKMVPLSHEEINRYTDNKAFLYILYDGTYDYRKSNEDYFYGNMAFYYGADCFYKSGTSNNSWFNSISSGCSSDYASSNVKSVVDAWTQEKISSDHIVAFEDGKLSRLIKISEIAQFDSQNNGTNILYNLDAIPYWLVKFNDYGWTNDESGQKYIYSIDGRYKQLRISGVFQEGSVRPTIKLKKNSINKVSFNEYHNNAKREYKIGDIINYNDTKFYVIKNSSESDSTVTLLKDSPLTKYELETYGEGYINNYI